MDITALFMIISVSLLIIVKNNIKLPSCETNITDNNVGLF